jgi:hypothetical protein
MQEDKRKSQLLELFTNISGKTKIVEPMKKSMVLCVTVTQSNGKLRS